MFNLLIHFGAYSLIALRLMDFDLSFMGSNEIRSLQISFFFFIKMKINKHKSIRFNFPYLDFSLIQNYGPMIIFYSCFSSLLITSRVFSRRVTSIGKSAILLIFYSSLCFLPSQVFAFNLLSCSIFNLYYYSSSLNLFPYFIPIYLQ